MGFQQAQMSGEASGEKATLQRIVLRLGIEIWAPRFVADALDMKLPAQEDGEDAAVFRAAGPQGSIAPLGGLQAATDGVPNTMRRPRFTYHRERLNIAPIRRTTQLDVPTEIGNPLAQGQPSDHVSTLTGGAAADRKSPRIIKRGLDSQDARLLVVPLEGIFFHPVFHAHAFHPPLQVTPDLSGKTEVGSPPQ